MTEGAERVVGVLLAAGRGVRFDPAGTRLKLLESAMQGPDRGEPLAVAAARTLRSGVHHVVAVVAPATNEQQQRLHDLLRAEGCVLAINPLPSAGQGSSIACGIKAATPADGWLIALADMPAIAPSTVHALVQALQDGAVTAAPVFRGQRGHPVAFAVSLGPRLLALTGDLGARAVLSEHPPRLIAVDDAGVLYDVDTPEDAQ